MALPKKIASEGLTMMAAAFGFVAALAWNEAVKALINAVVPQGSRGVASLFVYAVAVTVAAILISTHAAKVKEKLEEQ